MCFQCEGQSGISQLHRTVLEPGQPGFDSEKSLVGT